MLEQIWLSMIVGPFQQRLRCSKKHTQKQAGYGCMCVVDAFEVEGHSITGPQRQFWGRGEILKLSFSESCVFAIKCALIHALRTLISDPRERESPKANLEHAEVNPKHFGKKNKLFFFLNFKNDS